MYVYLQHSQFIYVHALGNEISIILVEYCSRVWACMGRVSRWIAQAQQAWITVSAYVDYEPTVCVQVYFWCGSSCTSWLASITLAMRLVWFHWCLLIWPRWPRLWGHRNCWDLFCLQVRGNQAGRLPTSSQLTILTFRLSCPHLPPLMLWWELIHGVNWRHLVMASKEDHST